MTPTTFQIVREATGDFPAEALIACQVRASKGGQARATKPTAEQRREIARRGAEAQWVGRVAKERTGLATPVTTVSDRLWKSHPS